VCKRESKRTVANVSILLLSTVSLYKRQITNLPPISLIITNLPPGGLLFTNLPPQGLLFTNLPPQGLLFTNLPPEGLVLFPTLQRLIVRFALDLATIGT
jgi:hypothetical protein